MAIVDASMREALGLNEGVEHAAGELGVIGSSWRLMTIWCMGGGLPASFQSLMSSSWVVGEDALHHGLDSSIA